MATEFAATERRSHLLSAVSHGGSYNVVNLCSTVEVTVATGTGDTYIFGRIPSNARLLGSSRLYWDDMATTGAPTMDIGLGAVESNLVNADDPDALSNGHALATATPTGAGAVAPIENFGVLAWDLVASETVDPGGELEVYGTCLDAVTTVAGTMTIELYYVID
jgi:hypothetical protein